MLTGMVFAGLVWDSIGPDGDDRFMVRISPGSPQTLFVTGYHAVHRSYDGGENWELTSTLEMAEDTFLDIAFGVTNNQEVVVAGVFSGTWYSPDEGASWEQRSTGLPLKSDGVNYFPVTSVATMPDGEFFAALSNNGSEESPPPLVYRSDNMGMSWVPESTGIPALTNGQQTVSLLSINAANQLWASVYGKGVFSYSNGVWSSRNGNLPAAALNGTCLAMDPADPNRVLLATQDSWVYETRDGGQSWVQLSLPSELGGLTTLPLAYMLVIDPNNPNLIVVRANDFNGPTEYPLFRPNAQQFEGDGTYISADGGSSWVRQSLFAFRLALDASETLQDFVPGLGIVLRSKSWYVAGGGVPSLLKSTDGGITYEIKNKGIRTGWVNSVWAHPNPPPGYDNLVYCAWEAGLFVMSNGTANGWTFAPSVENTVYTWSFAEDHTDPGTVFYSTGNPGWTTPDQRGIYSLPLTCFDPGCSPGDNQLVSSTGAWRVVTSPATPERVWAAGQENGVLVSINSGNSWVEFSNGIDPSSSITDIELLNDGTPLFASFRTSTGDPDAVPPLTWAPIPNEAGGVYFYDTNTSSWLQSSALTNAVFDMETVDVPTQTIFAATSAGLYRFTEAESWVLISQPGLINDVEVDPLRPGYIYIGTRIGVFRTTDGGQQWHDLSTGLPVSIIYSLDLDQDDGTLYAGTEGASVLRMLADTNPIPVIGPSLTNINFNAVPVGYSGEIELTVTNIGEADMIVSNLSLSPGRYTLDDVPVLPATITPGSWIEFTVIYTPSSATPNSGSLTISGDAVNSPVVIPLSGEGYTETGTLAVEVEPNSAGWLLIAPWGETTNRFGDLPGATVPTGTYTFVWQHLPGWVLPTNQPTAAFVPSGQSAQMTGIYTPTTSTTTSSSTTTSTVSTTSSTTTSSTSTTTSTSSTTSSSTTSSTTTTTSTSSTSTSSTTTSTSTSTTSTSTTTTSTSTVPLILTGISLTTNETIMIQISSASGEFYRVWWKDDLFVPWATGQSETAIGEIWEDTNIFIPSKCYRLTSEQP